MHSVLVLAKNIICLSRVVFKQKLVPCDRRLTGSTTHFRGCEFLSPRDSDVWLAKHRLQQYYCIFSWRVWLTSNPSRFSNALRLHICRFWFYSFFSNWLRSSPKRWPFVIFNRIFSVSCFVGSQIPTERFLSMFLQLRMNNYISILNTSSIQWT